MSPSRTLVEWLAYIERQHPRSIDMGLDRVREVAQRLGLQRPAPRVITVAGTNGKGSTVAFIEAIARADGRWVGAYTSPHLLRFNERVRIDGVDATDEQLVAALEAVEDARGAQSLTYFEYATLAALWLFERAGLDLAILEVGLGGRLDATNIVDPDVAVITTVDLDHQDYLGDEREAIGREKVGIARGWKPLVIGDDDPPSSVLGHAYAIGASALRIGCDFFFQRNEPVALAEAADPADATAPSGPTWRWWEVGYSIDLPMPQLAAPVQLRNAAFAIAALRALEGTAPSDDAIRRGVAEARVRARLQSFDRDGVQIVVDVGHNPQAAGAIADWMRACPVQGVTRAVFAALGDKDVTGVVAPLTDLVAEWHLAGLQDAGPRGMDATALAARLQDTAAAAGSVHAGVAEALQAARSASRSGDRILVFGSFHTAAAALALLAAG